MKAGEFGIIQTDHVAASTLRIFEQRPDVNIDKLRKLNAIADRLEAVYQQVGHPDYSLGEFYGDVKQVVFDLRAYESKLLEMQKDAGRYRWLCAERRGWFSSHAPTSDIFRKVKGTKANLDIAIDAALDAESGKEGK